MADLATQTFLKRIELEGRLDEFQTRCYRYAEGRRWDDWRAAILPVAAEYFRFKNVDDELKKIDNLEKTHDASGFEHLPESENLTEDVRWVLDHKPSCVKMVDGNVEIDDFYLAHNAPSRTAVTLMQYAASDLKGFMQQFGTTVLKMLKDVDDKESSEFWRDRPEDLDRIRKSLEGLRSAT